MQRRIEEGRGARVSEFRENHSASGGGEHAPRREAQAGQRVARHHDRRRAFEERRRAAVAKAENQSRLGHEGPQHRLVRFDHLERANERSERFGRCVPADPHDDSLTPRAWIRTGH